MHKRHVTCKRSLAVSPVLQTQGETPGARLWGWFGEARVLGQDCLPAVRSESGGCTFQTGPAWRGSTKGEALHCHPQHPLGKAPRGILSWKRVSSLY